MNHHKSTDTTPDAERALLQLRGLVTLLSPSKVLDAEARDTVALLLEELVERLARCLSRGGDTCHCHQSGPATR